MMSSNEPSVTAERIAALERDGLPRHERELELATALIDSRGQDAASVIEQVRTFTVAAPSWALGTGGTRFGRFPQPGEPRTTEEKLDDVAALNRLTGANRSVSLHVPWDLPSDPSGLREYAASLDLCFDAMNSNTFQDHPAATGGNAVSYKYGSLAHTSSDVRARAVEHNLHCIELGQQLGSTALTVWLADGTNHPGQADFQGQFERVADGLREIHDALPTTWQLLTEHKPYEPAFYSTVNADWGSSLLLAQHAGERASCLVDLGHHLPNTNIEQVVSRLGMVGRLGGFHFNDSKYGDDDLTVGSIRPFQLFLIVVELVRQGGGRLPDLRYMIDASHNVKDPLEDLIQATDHLHVTLAQALLVDTDRLADAQERNDPTDAAETLHAAFRSDVRPLVAEARRQNGAALDPVTTYRRSGYRQSAASRRGAAVATGL